MAARMVASNMAAVAVLMICSSLLTQVRGQAGPCDLTMCNNATCRCSSTEAPGGLAVEQIPQFVLLSFDDGVTVTNFPFYEKLSKYQNPNGCNISMTFFVSHENTDYTLVNELHRWGHEIATHSVSHKADLDGYWRNMTSETWSQEIVDMKTMLETFGNIPAEDITGFRVPFLEVGGNLMYQTLLEKGFAYDCSWPTLRYTPWYNGEGEPLGALWPYTLDYASVQEETVGTKPTDSFPGLWVNPMTDMQDNRGIECPMLDLCQSEDDELETSPEAVLDLLQRNFKTHYYGGRTPFGLYVHHSWFVIDTNNNSTARHDGFEMFLSYLSGFPDVYVASVNKAIEWVRNPYAFDDINNFEPLQCGDLPASDCPEDNHVDCYYKDHLPIDQQEVYMNICKGPCPPLYPWTGNPTGTNATTATHAHLY